jgi:esterase/lipase superfamily enzyme
MSLHHQPSLLFLCLAFLAGCATNLPDHAPKQVLIPLLYATDRNVDLSAGASSFYGSDRGELSFGMTTVALSPRKKGDSPFADWSRWQPRSDAAYNRNELLTVAPLDRGSFSERLGRSVILYVHGFRRDFNIAAMDLALVVYGADLRSVPIFFSWPSGNSVLGYAGDTTNARWATNDLRDTLRYLLNQPSVDTVHIAAHSLGGNGLLDALERLSQEDGVRIDKIGEVILASPDIDTGLFRREYLPLLRRVGSRTTLYITENDVPLQASQRVNRNNRLGDASSEIFIEDGIETVVFSDVVTFMNSHDAIVEIGNVQADLHYLLEDRLGANERPTLEAVDTEDGRYWRAQPYPAQ